MLFFVIGLLAVIGCATVYRLAYLDGRRRGLGEGDRAIRREAAVYKTIAEREAEREAAAIRMAVRFVRQPDSALPA